MKTTKLALVIASFLVLNVTTTLANKRDQGISNQNELRNKISQMANNISFEELVEPNCITKVAITFRINENETIDYVKVDCNNTELANFLEHRIENKTLKVAPSLTDKYYKVKVNFEAH